MTNDPGKPARRVKLSFVALVVVACAVTALLGYNTSQNHHAIRQLKVLADAQRQFRVERASRTSATDKLICVQVEKVKAEIRGVVVPSRADLLRTPYYRKHRDEIPAAIAAGRRVAKHFAPINCSRLPTSSGGAFPKKQKK